MAQWKETLEPYVKVIETVKSAPLNPTAGADLIIGAVIISDCGPGEPTLITGQKEFLKNFASEEITKKYTDSLNEFYEGDNKTLASTMWLNAYRLAGSGNLLVARAGKTDGLTYVKDLVGEDKDYIVKEGEVLRACSPFKLVLDLDTTAEAEDGTVTTASDGWGFSVKDTGVFGNRVNDHGPIYDYYCDNLVDLISMLNETSKFFIPQCSYYSDATCTTKVVDYESNKSSVVAVKLEVVYLAADKVMEPIVEDAAGNVEQWGYAEDGTTKDNWGDTDPGTGKADIDSSAVGCAYILPEVIDGTTIIDLNSENYSGFSPIDYYAINKYNSKSDLKVRVRRFNHNAVLDKVATGDDSPYTVQTSILDVYTNSGTEAPADSILKYDFYEFAVVDPAISEETQLFNVGNIPGRGDITQAELIENLSSIGLVLPEDLKNLGLKYYGYEKQTTGKNEISVNVCLDSSKENTKALLMVGNGDIMKAWDKIEKDERYIVEGLTDLGCTESVIQNYMANIAVNSNYFYPVSSTNSNNYMVIANKRSKITQDSSKIYFLAPYDLDDGTVGYLFNACSSILYWETVLKNKRNNQEFAAAFGQTHGVTSVVKLSKEFNKTERQLLLTKKINTIFHDVYLDRIYINDNWTAQTEDNVMKEECNERLRIRISKAIPVLLNQFKGTQNNSRTREQVVGVLDYWFKFTVMNYGSTIADYQIICDETNNTDEDVRANRLNVKVDVRYPNSIKYITVYHNAYPIGVDFSNE